MADQSKKVSKMINKLMRLARLAGKMAVICAFVLSGMILGGDSAFGSTLWDNTAVPAILSASDTSAVELGVKFQSSVDGYITGLRFYKSVYNTGTHVGSLWTASGILLASVTFTSETASGWQQTALADNAAEIRRLAVQLYERITTFTNHLGNVGKALGESVRAFNQSVGSLERMVLPSARRFTDLGVQPRQRIAAPTSLDELPRDVAPQDSDAAEPADGPH